MVTQEHLGRGQLINRLTAQVGSRTKAIGILINRGDLEPDGKTFTAKGLKRNHMTAAERAKDRASDRTGLPPSEFKYNSKTNAAIKRKK
jgi:hypothetical protein